MSNEGMRTPRREAHFEAPRTPVSQRQAPPAMSRMTFTPCTRLSQMTLGSQSSARTKHIAYEHSTTNFNAKLLEAVREDAQDHPNLTMVLGQDKISMDPSMEMDTRLGSSLSFQSDEDSDGLDSLRSYSPGPPFSPERAQTRSSIFDMEPLAEKSEPPAITSRRGHKSIFDEDDICQPMIFTDDDMMVGDDPTNDQHFDPSLDWVHHIYEDKDPYTDDDAEEAHTQETEAPDQENRQPRTWRREETDSGKKVRRYLAQEENNCVQSRAPLQEIHLDSPNMMNILNNMVNKDEVRTTKKLIVDKRGQASAVTSAATAASAPRRTKMRFMRSLSPTRDARRKGKQPAALSH